MPSENDPAFNFVADLDAIKKKGLFRSRKEIESPQGPIVYIGGKEFLNFCSNDYLGFANDQRLISTFKNAAEMYGIGSGASQLVCGRHTIHAELEEELAAATGRSRALVFSSGYLVNLAIISSFCNSRDSVVIEDRLNHASMIDGAQLSRAKLKRYHHLDTAHLKQTLEGCSSYKKLVLTDGVFSMDGDIAPISKIAELCDKHNAYLVLDDAHGFGVLGSQGMGLLEETSLSQNEVPLLMATFGKALGAFGAFVAGPEEAIEVLIQRARPYIFTTALPAVIAATVLESLKLVRAETWRREKLQNLIHRFREAALNSGLPIKDSNRFRLLPSPIFPDPL